MSLDGAFEVVAVARDEHDARTTLRRLFCSDETDAARGTGNDDDLFVKRQERNLHDCLSGICVDSFRQRFDETSDSLRPAG